MKHILRNFWVTLTHFKLASSLNILGLAVAFTVFTVIMMQTYWEFTYNDSIPEQEKLYYFESNLMVEDSDQPSICRPFVDQIADNSPALDSYALINRGSNSSFQTLNESGDLIKNEVRYYRVSKGFDDVLSLAKLSGDFVRFDEPSSALVTRSDAMRLFGTIDAAGKQIFGNDDTMFVAAVVADFPDNCMFTNGIYINMGDENIDNRNNWNYECVFKLKTEGSLDAFKRDFNKVGQDYFGNAKPSPFAVGVDPSNRYKLIPMDDTYFEMKWAPGNFALTSILIAIALLIVAIAMINFINFFMALVPIRIQSVNIHKIFGTPVASLRANIVGEAVGTVLIAFGLSLVILQLLQSTPINEYISCSILFADNVTVIIGAALVAVAIGILAGLYPAYYITKFPPMMVIRGSFGRSKAGIRLRATLVSIQYVISIALIIGAIFITLQTSFMRNAEMGYNRDRLITVQVHPDIASKPEAFLDLLRKNPDIIDVAYSGNNMVNVNMGWGRNFKGQEIYVSSLPVSWNYPEFIGVKLLDGRFFIPEDATKTSGTMIINEVTAKKYGMKVGDFFNGHSDEDAEIVGVVSDFNFKSLKYSVEPIVLYEFGSDGWYIPSMANIRITPTADYKAASEFIARSIKQLMPSMTDDQIVIRPFDDIVEALYQKEDRLNTIITLFSVVAILISLVGVFGLVVFEVQYRRKEIALRKIHGASVKLILAMINRKFVIITAISAVIAIPAIYVGVWYWLQSFAVRVALSWWVALIAVLLVWAITVAIVTIQTLRAATENPINSLKSN